MIKIYDTRATEWADQDPTYAAFDASQLVAVVSTIKSLLQSEGLDCAIKYYPDLDYEFRTYLDELPCWGEGTLDNTRLLTEGEEPCGYKANLRIFRDGTARLVWTHHHNADNRFWIHIPAEDIL